MTTPIDPSIPQAPHPAPEEMRYGTLNVVLDGERHAIGWQWLPAEKGGPAYVTAQRAILGGRKVLERYPLTDDGWAQAWTAFARLDPAAANKTHAALATGRAPANRTYHTRTGLIVAVCCVGLAVWLLGFYAYIGGFGPPSGEPAIDTKVAVSRLVSGQVTIYELACPGEWVRQVDLALVDPGQGTDRAILWEIRSSTRTTASQFTVGESPPGFRTVKPLTLSLKPADDLSAEIVVNGGDTLDRGIYRDDKFSQDFYPHYARPGSLYLLGGYLDPSYSGVHVSPGKFSSARDLVCKNQNNPIGG